METPGNYHLLSKFTRLRKKPQQPLTDLTELYGKIANESIYYLKLEELGDFKAALQGWKALNTDVMYRLTVIEHEYPSSSSYTREESSIKSGVRELYHKSLMHLERVKKLYDDDQKSHNGTEIVELRSRKSPPSSQHSSFVKRSHLQHAFNGSARKMATTLRDSRSRPSKSTTSSLRSNHSLDPRTNGQGSGTHNRVNFVPSKPLVRRRLSPPPDDNDDHSALETFEGFDNDSELIDLTQDNDEEMSSVLQEASQNSLVDDPIDFDFEDYYGSDEEMKVEPDLSSMELRGVEHMGLVERQFSNLSLKSPPLIAAPSKPTISIKDRPPIPTNQPPIPTMRVSPTPTLVKTVSQPAQTYQKPNNSTGNLTSSNNGKSAYRPKNSGRLRPSSNLKTTKSTPVLDARSAKNSASTPAHFTQSGKPQTASAAAKKVLGLCNEVKESEDSNRQPRKPLKRKAQATGATRSLTTAKSPPLTIAAAKKKAQAGRLAPPNVRISRNDNNQTSNPSSRVALSTSPESIPSVDEKRGHTTPPIPSSAAPSLVVAGECEVGDHDKLKEELEDEIINSLIGVDKIAAKQIFAEIVVRGDEVHWEDIAGLESAKGSLKEAVVYPFLRPDLFRGLREPVRGMLLFGPPGTGKTMLARAVATESHSTFFSISASSLTSKYLGESEKLVRALFAVAKKLSPSIIFVDEIDSIMGSRNSDGENESSRRIKNEFLIQWSSLSSAAAGNSRSGSGDDDDERVLVLAATNLPWSIDEAARRRFVRRQYIPLPEPETRSVQLKRLLSHQKHSLTEGDFTELLKLTDGFSGSDITSLAKDAAMGPLRELGDKLLLVPTESIRPMSLEDFKSSLNYIKPSVSQEGLQHYEDWAAKFGSSGS